jgi:dipeptidyl aminopeptidase/acylaminoacyl peptidase
MRIVLRGLLAAALVWHSAAQNGGSVRPKQLTLTVDEIMRGPALYGNSPRAVRWSADGRQVYFEWKAASEPLDKNFDTYVVSRDGTGLRKLPEEQALQAPPAGGSETLDKKRVVFADHGDLFVYERDRGERRELTRTTEAESSPRWTRDGKRVAFLRGGNLFALSVDSGLLEQLTDIRPPEPAGAPPPPDHKGTESQEALKKEERALLEVVESRAKKREEEEEKRKKDNPRKPWHLTAKQTVSALLLAPDESYILAAIADPGEGVKRVFVPNYVTESAYTEELSSRTKVGDVQTLTRWAVLNTKSGEVTWIDPGLTEKSAGNDKPVERAVQLSGSQWSDDGSRVAFLARSADNKDRWILGLDAKTGKMKELAHQHDDAWVDGPGSLLLGWLADNRHIYYQSEASGYSHLYTLDAESGESRQITSGNWEVDAVTLSRDKTKFYLTTSEEGPEVRNVYSVPTEGGPRTKITTDPGSYEIAVVSPDDRMLAVVHSYINRPPELYLMENRAGAPMNRVTSSPAPDFGTYEWLDVPIVKIPARDGVAVPARLYKPKQLAPGAPAVVFVHGAGYLQNVHRWWSYYAHEYLFHHLLMEKGYVVVDLDYRGSAGYGRDWRAAVYRHMGGKDLEDQVDAARWVVREHGVDPKRIGIYGGSYGGFITLMAMFTQPGVFAAGAALRPVTDWAHYNHGYTSNILNLPQKDLEAYKVSSPIYHAAGLQGALLICHGVVDVNVHFQDTVRLVEKLIELHKENWELAVYPAEDHGFVQPSSWADEYKRILRLFETNLRSGVDAGSPSK